MQSEHTRGLAITAYHQSWMKATACSASSQKIRRSASKRLLLRLKYATTEHQCRNTCRTHKQRAATTAAVIIQHLGCSLSAKSNHMIRRLQVKFETSNASTRCHVSVEHLGSDSQPDVVRKMFVPKPVRLHKRPIYLRAARRHPTTARLEALQTF